MTNSPSHPGNVGKTPSQGRSWEPFYFFNLPTEFFHDCKVRSVAQFLSIHSPSRWRGQGGRQCHGCALLCWDHTAATSQEATLRPSPVSSLLHFLPAYSNAAVAFLLQMNPQFSKGQEANAARSMLGLVTPLFPYLVTPSSGGDPWKGLQHPVWML